MNGLEELSVTECLGLVRSLSVGRLAVNRPGLPPLVVPVNYVVESETILFRTGPGTKFDALCREPVSFQVDFIDPFHRTGWSVLVEGSAALVSSSPSSERKAPQVESWVADPRQALLACLTPTAVSGRRIRLPDIEADTRGYL